MKVRFENVGRDKRSWTADIPVDTLDSDTAEALMLASIRNKRALMSSDIWLAGDQNGGTIQAGFHTVGRWRVED